MPVSRRSLWTFLILGLALGLLGAGVGAWSTSPGELRRIVPFLGPGHSEVTSTTQQCFTERPEAYNGETNPCRVIPWGSVATFGSVTGTNCFCFAMTSTITMESTCGALTDAEDGNDIAEGNCFNLKEGLVMDWRPDRRAFLRVGAGRRDGQCTGADRGRPCLEDGDCPGASTCVGGGASASRASDFSAAGVYLLIRGTDVGEIHSASSYAE